LKSKYRRGDNAKTNLKEIECEDVNWIQLAQDTGQLWALLGMEINYQVPLKQGNFLFS
jgi:hypothetical protein